MNMWRCEMCMATFACVGTVFYTIAYISVGGVEGYVSAVFWGILSVISLGAAVIIFRERKMHKFLDDFDKRKAKVWNDILTNDSIDEATRARQIQTMIGIQERTSDTR